MIELSRRLFDQALQQDEIYQQAGFVQLGPFDGHLNAKIMAMKGLGPAMIVAKRMGCRKDVLQSDFKQI